MRIGYNWGSEFMMVQEEDHVAVKDPALELRIATVLEQRRTIVSDRIRLRRKFMREDKEEVKIW